MDTAFRAGTILLGKYRVESVLGRDGMCLSLRVTYVPRGDELVLTMLRPETATSLAAHARFLRDAQSAARLRGEHVARVFDVGVLPDGVPYVVTEAARGVGLASELARRGALPPGEAVDYMLQVCDALAEAHAHGVLHRAIKPSNLVLSAGLDGAPFVKLIDFGITRTPVAMTGALGSEFAMGTPGYMSPEQMKATEDLDPRTDVWAVGVVLYECLAGKHPFRAASPAATARMAAVAPPEPLDPRIPGGLQAVVWRCLEKARDARFPSTAALATALRPFAHDQRSAALIVQRASLMAPSASGASDPTPPPGQYPVVMPPTVVAIESPSRTRQRYATIAIVALAVSIGGIAAAALIRPSRPRGPISTLEAELLVHEVATNPRAANPGTASPSVVDPAAANPGAANADAANAGATNAAASNAGATNAGAANAGTANAGTANSGTANSGTASPNAGNPGAGNPGAGNPISANPNSANPGTATPNPATPGLTNPGPGNPTSATPNPANPGPVIPGAGNPGTANPSVARPSTPAPATNPGASEASQKLSRCDELQAQKAWKALDDCASELAKLGAADRAQQLRSTARQERQNEIQSDKVQQALRDGNLKDAQAALRQIDASSVYAASTRANFAKAEQQRVDDAKRKAQSLASAHDCAALKRLATQLSSTGTDRVAVAAQAVTCDEEAPAGAGVAERPAAPPPAAPATRARAHGCDSVDVNDVMTRAAIQFDSGSPASALSLTRVALGCKQTDRMYWLAVMYACAARDAASARQYFPKVPANLQSGVESKCQRENLDVRTR